MKKINVVRYGIQLEALGLDSVLDCIFIQGWSQLEYLIFMISVEQVYLSAIRYLDALQSMNRGFIEPTLNTTHKL